MLKDSWDITTFAQLRQAANDIAAHLSQYGGIIALHGDLGAGKTTLVQSIALALGITQPVASPTFALVLEYPLPDGRSLVHMDLYRLSGLADLDSIGFEEYLDSGDIIAIEWAERAATLLPPNTLHLTLTLPSSSSRHLALRSAVAQPPL